MDDFTCDREVRPVAEWVKDETDSEEDCPPCLIMPLSSYYLGALEEAGETKLAGELQEVYESGDVLTISEKLDTIKADVGEALRNQLRNLDCFAQTFKPNKADTQ